VRVHRGVTVTSVAPSLVSGADEFDQLWEMAADGVVLVTQQRSDDALLRALRTEPQRLADAGIEAVYGIGDATAPRPLSEAVFDGHRLAREIDSADPNRPLPYLRERPSGVRQRGRVP